MPLITTKRGSPCAACGGTIRGQEQAWYTQEGGVRHPEEVCRNAPSTRYRANRRAGTCSCGAHVPASAGRLVHLGGTVKGSRWGVRCMGCAP